MKTKVVLMLLVVFSLGFFSCTQPDSVESETELFSPGGGDEEVKEEPGED